MKGKLSSMWRATLALVLVLSLGVVMAAPVSAAVTQPEVSLDDYSPTTATVYTIEFTTNEDLAIGDGIVIEFPAGTTGLGSIATSDVTVDSVTIDSVINVDQRLSITLGAALEAGDITLVVGNSNKVTNPDDEDYTLDVYTSQEPTAVTSETYIISKMLGGVNAPSPSPTTVATASTYDIDFTTSAEMRASDTIVIEFPVDTGISTVVKADITVDDLDGADPAVDSISINGQVLTITLGGTLAAGDTTVTVANHIINPTTVLNPDPYESDATNEWRVTVYTNYLDRIPAVSGVYTLSEGTAVSQVAWLTVDDYVPSDTPSTEFKIQTRDQYGNAAVASTSGAVSFALTASSGAFYSDSGCGTGTVITTINIAQSQTDSGSDNLYYKGAYNAATEGTVTITADEVSSQGWTAAEITILVNPMLELWGGGSCRDEYKTFTAAMTDALPYDTIKVAPSTYDGFTVNQPYLTIESTAGAATTTIEGNITLNAGADNFVLGGVAGKGFTLKKGIESLIALNGSDDVTISYNTLETTTTRLTGATQVDAIRIWQQASSGLTVTENTFIIDSTFDMGVRGHTSGPVSGLTVTDNTFTGTDNTLETSAIQIDTLDISDESTPKDTVISGNEITGVTYGVAIGAQSGDLQGDEDNATFEISDNTFDGLAYGIWLIAVPDANNEQNVVITENTFTSNTKGLAISADIHWLPEDFTVRYNDFSGNTYAVFNAFSTALTAQHNWWNDVTGPSTDPDVETPIVYGAGDPISALVTYSPWLAVSQSVCVPATSSRYAIEIRLTNVASYSAGTWSGGWNTFSTPIWLDGSANTWGEIAALATLDYAGIFGWDGTNWTAVVASTPVTPLDAIFVQLKTEAQSLPILFSTQLSPAPTKAMSTGWELVGQANLSAQTRDVTLASLGTVGGADLKYSQVIDPISGAVIAFDGSMVVGAGYWVFMTDAGTLAGFSVTPQPFVPVTP